MKHLLLILTIALPLFLQAQEKTVGQSIPDPNSTKLGGIIVPGALFATIQQERLFTERKSAYLNLSYTWNFPIEGTFSEKRKAISAGIRYYFRPPNEKNFNLYSDVEIRGMEIKQFDANYERTVTHHFSSYMLGLGIHAGFLIQIKKRVLFDIGYFLVPAGRIASKHDTLENGDVVTHFQNKAGFQLLHGPRVLVGLRF